MTLNAKLPVYREQAENIVKDTSTDDLKMAKIINLCQQAFTDGVVSIMQKTATKNRVAATKEFNEDISNYYLSKNYRELSFYLMSLIKEYNVQGGELVFGYEDLIKDDFKNIIKSIYDMGLVSGITVAQDPNKLKVYLSNKDTIENGDY